MPIPVETFFLDPASDGTLQQQIQRMIADGILAGRFRQGEKMPSSRKLAGHLGVSRITVTLAYTDLVANDYLISKGRSGYYVSENAPVTPDFQMDAPIKEEVVDWSRALTQRPVGYRGPERPENWRSFKYPFIYGQTDPKLFDHQNWRNCALQALGQRDFEAMTQDYYERDDPLLVNYICSQILPRRGITARPEEILITMGAQNALWMTAQILLSQRRMAVMENPCYPQLREILQRSQCRTHFVDVDQDGLNPDLLPRDTEVVFTTPSHHCPTNVTMPIERRHELLFRAKQDRFLIVEDDYEFEISFHNATKPALKAMDGSGSVIYVGSFSKSLFPGLRLGFLVAAEPVIQEARSLRALVLRHAPGHIQRTAAYFLSRGYYDSQLNRVARAYRRRRSVMTACLREHGFDMGTQEHAGGSSFWLKAPDGINTSQLTRRLREHGVLIESGRSFFDLSQDNRSHFRLSYSSISSDRIADGIGIIASEMAKG